MKAKSSGLFWSFRQKTKSVRTIRGFLCNKEGFLVIEVGHEREGGALRFESVRGICTCYTWRDLVLVEAA